MIAETSQKAFREEVVPTMSDRHERLLRALDALGEATNSELGRYLDWSINRVTPRTNELVKAGKVVDVGKRPCKVTGRTAYVWIIKPIQTPLI